MLFASAAVLATATFVGGYVIWQKLPHRVRLVLQERSVLTDLGLLCVGYIILGGTATALLAPAMLGLVVAVVLRPRRVHLATEHWAQ